MRITSPESKVPSPERFNGGLWTRDWGLALKESVMRPRDGGGASLFSRSRAEEGEETANEASDRPPDVQTRLSDRKIAKLGLVFFKKEGKPIIAKELKSSAKWSLSAPCNVMFMFA